MYCFLYRLYPQGNLIIEEAKSKYRILSWYNHILDFEKQENPQKLVSIEIEISMYIQNSNLGYSLKCPRGKNICPLPLYGRNYQILSKNPNFFVFNILQGSSLWLFLAFKFQSKLKRGDFYKMLNIKFV